jgi:hypothetical protein
MSKIITNEDILNIYNNDKYKKLMYAASRFYLKVLDEDEIESCKLKAILLSLDKYDASKGTKYETFLYRGVLLECKTQSKLKRNNRNIVFNSGDEDIFIQDNRGSESDYNELIELIDTIENGNLLKMKYIENMTLKQISKINGESEQLIHNKVKKAKKTLKEFLLGV